MREGATPAPRAVLRSAVAHDFLQRHPDYRERLVLGAPFICSRLLLVVLSAIVALIRRQNPVNLWAQWDGRWYVGIAAHGYHWSIGGKPAVAFFPLFPLLIRCLTPVGIPGILAGLLVSNAACAGASFYLYRLVTESYGPEIARRALWLPILLPTGFFFFAPYSESLCLLCAVAAIYAARHHNAGRAGLWTAGALLTRPTGIAVAVAALVALASSDRARYGRIRTRAAIAVLVPPALGLLAYLWYLGAQRVPLAALTTAEQSWHRGMAPPWTGFQASLEWLAAHGQSNIAWTAENLLQTAVTVLLLALTAVAWRDLTWDERAYCAVFWLLVLLTPEWRDSYYAPFSSMDRFVLVLFPLWIWCAARLPSRRTVMLLALSGAGMLAATAVHLAGGWVG